MKKTVLFLLFAAFLGSYWGCEETPDAIDYNPNVRSARNYIYAEDVYLEIFNIFFKAIHDSTLLANGYTFLDDTDIENHQTEDNYHFHYGVEDRYCGDNKWRRGTFIAQFDGPVFEVGTTATITTDSLFVNYDLVECTMVIRNLGKNALDKFEFEYIITDGKITLADSTETMYIQYETDEVITWNEGDHSPQDPDDDILSITGMASGYSVKGEYFTVTIQQTLFDKLSCNWIVEGVSGINVPSATALNGTIDYLLEDDCNYEVHFIFNDNLFYEFLPH